MRTVSEVLRRGHATPRAIASFAATLYTYRPMPSRILAERCSACDASLRAAERRVVRGVPLVLCACCGHHQVERQPVSPPDDANSAPQGPSAWRWNSFEKAARRLLALRALGYDGGRLLDLGHDASFANIAAAGPFDVLRVDCAEPEPPTSLIETLQARELSDAHFTIVTCWNGLAYEREPVALLEALRRKLEPGGVLALAVHLEHDPCASRHVSRGPDPLCCTRHLFSLTSLRTAVLRAGFDIRVIVPADLQPRVEGLRVHDRLVARVSLSLLGALARERRYAARFMPEVLWRLAHTAELWAFRPR